MYDKPDVNEPLSTTSVSLKLSLIQRRCSEFLDDSDGLELTLEDVSTRQDGTDPYNRQS